MSWPTPQEYNEAIQTPALCFSDQDLRLGSLSYTALGLPRAISGSFASVYRLSTDNGDFALRCLLSYREDQEERYERISEFVLFDDLECTVDFHYLKKGIRVKGQWFPLIKMDWVEGDTLDQFIIKNHRNRNSMLSLAQSVYEMGTELDRAAIAHGDLQHGNIIVSDSGANKFALRLVDYDGLYIPALKGKKSMEIGHANYQHPLRNEYDFDTTIDNFSLWLIYLSIGALAIDPELFESLEGGDECILFRASDLRDPENSRAFQLISRHDSQEIRNFGTLLTRMLWALPSQIPELDCTDEDLLSLPAIDALDSILLAKVISNISTAKHQNEFIPELIEHEDGIETANGILLRGDTDFTCLIKSAATEKRKNGRTPISRFKSRLSNSIKSFASRAVQKATPAYWASMKELEGDNQLKVGDYEYALRCYVEAGKYLERAYPVVNPIRLDLYLKTAAVFALSGQMEMSANFYRLVTNECHIPRLESYRARAELMTCIMQCKSEGGLSDKIVESLSNSKTLASHISWIVNKEIELKVILEPVAIELLMEVSERLARVGAKSLDLDNIYKAKSILISAVTLNNHIGYTDEKLSRKMLEQLHLRLGLVLLELDETLHARNNFEYCLSLAIELNVSIRKISDFSAMSIGTFKLENSAIEALEDRVPVNHCSMTRAQELLKSLDPESMADLYTILEPIHPRASQAISLQIIYVLNRYWLNDARSIALLKTSWKNILSLKRSLDSDLIEILDTMGDEVAEICLRQMHIEKNKNPLAIFPDQSWSHSLCLTAIAMHRPDILAACIAIFSECGNEEVFLTRISQLIYRSWQHGAIVNLLQLIANRGDKQFIGIFKKLYEKEFGEHQI